jgi:hypothetical protein
MQYVNNDMDDLFRRAAENYPLNTEGADWDKVMQGLETGRSGFEPPNNKILNRYFWIAAIFLIVFCTTYIQKTEHLLQSGDNVVTMKTGDHSKTGEKQLDGTLKYGKKAEKKDAVQQSENSLVHKKEPNTAFIKPVKAKSPFLILPKEKAPEQRGETNEQELTKQDKVNETGQKGFAEVERIKAYGQLSLLDTIQLRAPDEITIAKDNSEQKAIGNSGTKVKLPAQKLYAGFAGGPDVSTVRSQKASNAGYSLGLFVGYQFSKRLSLETGVIWDRKDYYSTGEYFDKGRLNLPQHAKIIDVDGYCNMFEIPVNLKFNWAQKNHYNLFATTGLSNYLMKKEAYDYTVDYYGVQSKYNKQYNNASRNWVSILNLSIGYEKKIGNAGSLRLEPYLKLPLKGVGIGNMPIGSKGVLIGFTRPIL